MHTHTHTHIHTHKHTQTHTYCGVMIGSSLEWYLYKCTHKLRLSTKMSDPVAALLPSNIIEVWLNKTWLAIWLAIICADILGDDHEMIQYSQSDVV